jgi:hypothetical protein
MGKAEVTNRPSFKNESGQMIVEYLLLSAIIISISVMVSTALRSNEMLGQLVSAPWRSLSGMIQNGSWGEPEATMIRHPNNHSSSSSLRGDKIK